MKESDLDEWMEILDELIHAGRGRVADLPAELLVPMIDALAALSSLGTHKTARTILLCLCEHALESTAFGSSSLNRLLRLYGLELQTDPQLDIKVEAV